MKIINLILRTISFIYTICFTLPVYILVLLVNVLYELLNGFSYHAFVGFTLPVPLSLTLHAKAPFIPMFFFKVLWLIVYPLVMCYHQIKAGIKSVKF